MPIEWPDDCTRWATRAIETASQSRYIRTSSTYRARFRRPRTIFVNSMSDLFHEKIPADFIRRVFQTMVDCPQHTFQVLTKRSGRLLELSNRLPWPENVWMGVSVEDDRAMSRIRDLVRVPAHIRFLSCEPLIGPLNRLPLRRMSRVIVGGESGPGRPMRPEWVESIRGQCANRGVPFFFKQWGGVQKGLHGRVLNGRTYDGCQVTRSRQIVNATIPAGVGFLTRRNSRRDNFNKETGPRVAPARSTKRPTSLFDPAAGRACRGYSSDRICAAC